MKCVKKIFIIVTALLLFGTALTGCGDLGTSDVNLDNEETSVTDETSDALEAYRSFEGNENMSFEIPNKAAQFIIAHPDFFPGNDSNTGAMSDFVDTEVYYMHLSKNISKHVDKLVQIYGDVVDIEESPEGDVTYLQVDTGDGQYVLYYLGTLDDVFEGSYVYAYALPFSMVTFENIGNTYTEAVVGAACYVEAIQY